MSATADATATSHPSAQRARADGPQLRTLLLTDLVDSTTLVERLGDGPAAALFREHDRLVLELQQRWHGRLIDRSDGLLLLFERAIDGLGFALDYTRGLRTLSERDELKQRKLILQARVGLHVGEVLSWRNSDEAVNLGAKPLEVEGLAKPFAARLMTLAQPGQILLSAVAEPLAHRASSELGPRGEQLLWKSYGRWCFKGIPEAQEIYEVGEAGVAPLRAPKSTAKSWRDIPFWRRPAALGAELLLVSGLAIGTWFMTRPQPAIAFAERDWVVVGDLRNLTGDKLLDDSLQQAFRISLEQSRYVNVLSDLKARDTLALMQRKPGTTLDRAIASEIALRDGVRAVILPTVSEVGGRVRVSAEVIDPHTQTTVYAESADGSGAASTLGSIDTVTAALRGKLGEALESVEKNSAPLPQVSTGNLDALRAYALGQNAFGHGRYADALGFYDRAIQLDPQFALAYVGGLRAHFATSDTVGGMHYLSDARRLRVRLPPRDQLYLDAWGAQVEAPADALDKWRLMASLYPDFFPAAANVAIALYERNRFSEGLPFALRATSPKNEFAPLSWDLVGRLSLGQEHFQEARQAFARALAQGATSSMVRLANTEAAQFRFTEAAKAWPKGVQVNGPYCDRATIYLDRGAWQLSREEATACEQAASRGSPRARQALLSVATVAWMEGRVEDARATLHTAADQYLDAIDAARAGTDVADDAYAAIAAGLLAQRLGDRMLPEKVSARLRQHADVLRMPGVPSLFAVLQANALLASQPARSVQLLRTTLDGSEPVQAHVALQEAYSAIGDRDAALAQARWVVGHRGRAYIEVGCVWCLQPLNVADTTLAQLRVAELLAAGGDHAAAQRELARFDRRWPEAALPDHLRRRRALLVAAFN